MNENEVPEAKIYSYITEIPEEYLKGKILRIDELYFCTHNYPFGQKSRIEITRWKDNSI